MESEDEIKVHERAEVDHLANWLHDKGWPTQRLDQGPTGVNMVIYDDDGQQALWWNLDEQMISFPTILDAFKAAVRALYEQEASDGSSP